MPRNRTLPRWRRVRPESDLAPMEEGQAIHEASDLVHALGGPDDRGPSAGRRHGEIADPLSAIRVEVMGGFVDQQEGRVHQEGPGDGEPFLHPVRVAAHAVPGCLLEADVPEASPCPPGRVGSSKAMEASKEDQVLEARDAEVERTVTRGNQAHQLTKPHGRQPLPGDPLDPQVTTVGIHQAAQDPKESGLTSAVRTEEGMNLSGTDLERDLEQRLRPPEAPRKVVDLDDRVARAGRRPPHYHRWGARHVRATTERETRGFSQDRSPICNGRYCPDPSAQDGRRESGNRPPESGASDSSASGGGRGSRYAPGGAR